MKRSILVAVASIAMFGTAYCETIKVGVIGPLSGPYSLQGRNFKAGIDAYMATHGDKVGDNTVEIVYRDLAATDPAQSKALAQELVIKEKVQYLTGFYFTPDALAVTPILAQANVPMVIMNAGASAIVTKSPLIVRTSFTTWQTSMPMGKVAYDDGVSKVITVVSDYGPGIDAESAFKSGFEKEGGRVVESIHMPLATNDFSPIMQRIKDSGAQGVFAFFPAGPPTLAFVKAYNENGLKDGGIKFFAPGDLVQEPDLPALGNAALGIRTTYHYAVSHDSPENKAFVDAAAASLGKKGDISFPAVAAYDGMHVIYKMIEATGGKQNAQKAVDAVKGLSWMSPRGPVSIDPQTRHITQNIYLREVSKAADGTYYNKEVQTFEKQGDPGLAAAR
jgi:branched-chain amino acid transport system substrate-binding protein